MGAYAYCQQRDCGAGLSQPTIREAVEGKQNCHYGHENELYHQQEELISILESFEERLKALESPSSE